ncbi:hypothetical protein ACFVWR_18480 [Leifsonia sp. NPDC058292]|uniref:hypothetical protein n=1 Tax=Leifsonia sp. NPDC058292 TaxID=3346428 RepID=UPI0036D767E7
MSSPNPTSMSPTAAHRELVDHKWYRYRVCAPDPDEPSLAAGSIEQDGKTVRVPLSAWSAPDLDGGEPQDVRIARENMAIEACLGCRVMVACNRYANTVDADGHVTEPQGVLGGERGLDRHKRLIARRHQVVAAAPDARFQTEQKQAVLRALAVHSDPLEVAAAAGLDERTANWQRSHLVRLLGLPRDASRGDLLAAAAGRGLLDGVSVVEDGKDVPAIVPPGRPAVAPKPAKVKRRRAASRARSIPRPRSISTVSSTTARRVRPVQLSLWEIPSPDNIVSLESASRLEAAA